MIPELNKLHTIIDAYMQQVAPKISGNFSEIEILKSYYNDIVLNIDNVISAAKRQSVAYKYQNSKKYQKKFGKKTKILHQWIQKYN